LPGADARPAVRAVIVDTFGIEMLTKEVHGFTPLILAARAGQAKMVRHILKRHMTMRWKW